MTDKTTCPAPDWSGSADRGRTVLRVGRTYRVRTLDRWGKPNELAGLSVTLTASFPVEPGLDDCSGFVHASSVALELLGHSSRSVRFSGDELEETK